VHWEPDGGGYGYVYGYGRFASLPPHFALAIIGVWEFAILLSCADNSQWP
jgi:hypothetical protein